MVSSAYEVVETDILIIGSGGAGLLAALHAQRSDPRLDITLASRGLIGKSGCTRMVQGGYNAAIGADDSVERHFMDTIHGGKWLPNQEMAWTLCATAATRIRELEEQYGCYFDRSADGGIHQKPFAGQTADRTIHKGDLTGIEIMNRLMEQVRALPLRRLEEHRAVALIPARGGGGVGDDPLAGALLIDIHTGNFIMVRAAAILLASGGGPTMYRYHTPSGDKSMDGLAMALRVRLPLRDMEMVQFHPTGLLAGRDTRLTGTVLEEGLRGAGGHLLDGAGERFLFAHDAAGERATRDIVSRAIYTQMRAGNTAPNGGVWLSMAHLGADTVRRLFPGMVKRCADCGFDLAGGRVEVVPTAHYFMGGVVCAADTSTAIRGLYVAGEDAGGAHGANRLGGNGVANSTVFGGIAGRRMARYVAGLRGDFSGGGDGGGDGGDTSRAVKPHLPPPDHAAIQAEIHAATTPFRHPRGDLNALRLRLMDIMWDEVGVLRDEAGLQRALTHLAALQTTLQQTGLDQNASRHFNLTWQDWLSLRSLLAVSQAITHAALARQNSRGAHHREDHPDLGALEDSYFTVTQQRDEDELAVSRQPVEFTIVRPGESLLDESAPTP